MDEPKVPLALFSVVWCQSTGQLWKQYDTSSINAEHQFSFWREAICANLSPTECIPTLSKKDFAAALKRVDVGKLSLCEKSSGPMRYSRTPQTLRRLPNDDFFVATITSGRGEMSQGGRQADPVAGDVVIYDSARLFEWAFYEDVSMTIARVPRRLLVGRIPEIEQLTARILRCDQPYTSLITSSLQEIARLPNSLHSGHAERLGMSVIDLLSASLECAFLREEVSLSHGDILKRAKKFLYDNLEDPELDLEQAVHALGVSQRTLCRVFAADGTTAIRWLWQQRLDLAFRLLSEGQIKSVSQVAMQCGFSDFSHFGRAFKKAYGVLPKSVLRTPVSMS